MIARELRDILKTMEEKGIGPTDIHNKTGLDRSYLQKVKEYDDIEDSKALEGSVRKKTISKLQNEYPSYFVNNKKVVSRETTKTTIENIELISLPKERFLHMLEKIVDSNSRLSASNQMLSQDVLTHILKLIPANQDVSNAGLPGKEKVVAGVMDNLQKKVSKKKDKSGNTPDISGPK